jgi:Protein of unknown function (DUF3313)
MRSHKEVSRVRHTVMLAACTLTLAGRAAIAGSGFLTDYSRLERVTSPTGTDLLYTAPDAAKRMADYTGVLIDWPEIHFSADSEYRGMKPQDIEALAQIMRDTLKSRIEAGGHYRVVAKPAADVLYVRTALTELYLKKKKRPVLAYTPVGAVARVGTQALKDAGKGGYHRDGAGGRDCGQSIRRGPGCPGGRARDAQAQGGRSEGAANGR